MTTTLPQEQPSPPEGFRIDPRLGAATLRAPAVSREDFCPQAILKFHPPSSLDYKGLPQSPVSLKSLLNGKTFIE